MAANIGHTMACPECRRKFQVGLPERKGPAGNVGTLFSFRCALCNSRLEAYTGLVGRRGQCPTCGAQFRVPAPTEAAVRTGGTDPQREYAQPVHAFAAAGDKAPKIVRLANGQQAIQCPRCNATNRVDRNNCRNCAAPFTLEGAESKTPGGGLATASLVVGIIGLFTFCLMIPSLLAVIFGILGLREQGTVEKPSRGRAIAGLILGILGLAMAIVRMFL